MENNKISAKIYGQEFVISGEMPREDIVQVAAHVDMKMNEIAEAIGRMGANSSNVAILAAVNITGDYFKAIKEIEELKSLNVQLEKDAQHYVQLWDESKKNYSDYKEETQSVGQQKEKLMAQIMSQEEEIARLKKEIEEAESAAKTGMDNMIDEIEGKCRELENSFFDLQMENLQLKKELDKYKNSTGQF